MTPMVSSNHFTTFKRHHHCQRSLNLIFLASRFFLLPAVADNDAKDAIGADYEAVYADDDIVRRTQG